MKAFLNLMVENKQALNMKRVVAAAGMSSRTFQRQLKEEGASFSDLLADVRRSETLKRLVLLCHKLARWQQGQRGKRRAMLRASLIRIVAIDALMWRSARIGGSAGSITRG